MTKLILAMPCHIQPTHPDSALQSYSSRVRAGSPEATQALLLRLRTQLWLGSGHGFNALSDALLGTGAEIPSKQQRDSVELRVTRAQCLRAVCAQDVGKGCQLLEGIEVRNRSL